MKTREEYLNELLHGPIAAWLADAGAIVPEDARVSIGFPGGGSARKRIGECWPRSRSSAKVNEIFISPVLGDDLVQTIDVLVHEAIHASDDCASGHKGHFARVARRVGLQGKMTSTCAGPALRAAIEAAIALRAPYPAGSLTLSGRKVQKTRMVKHECHECGAIWRMAAKWEVVSCPVCQAEL
jgi:hypothetical protein